MCPYRSSLQPEQIAGNSQRGRPELHEIVLAAHQAESSSSRQTDRPTNKHPETPNHALKHKSKCPSRNGYLVEDKDMAMQLQSHQNLALRQIGHQARRLPPGPSLQAWPTRVDQSVAM
eukprot:938961-Amphidinium_carterae.1